MVSEQTSGEAPQTPEDAQHTGKTDHREDLVNARRIRQQRPAGVNKKLIATSIVICSGLFVLVLVVSGGMKSLLSGGDIGQRASQVNMEVGRDRTDGIQLDFVVPAKSGPEKKEADPDAAWNERFKAMQAQIIEISKQKPTGASNAEIQRMLSQYNDAMSEKMDAQSKAMALENARLRDDAARAEDERRRLEDAARQTDAQIKESQMIEKKKRESDSVVVDEGRRGLAATGLESGGDAQGELNANQQFLKSSASSVTQTSVSTTLPYPSQTVIQGTIVSAVLETAIDTQLPGNLRAQVMEPVYSFDGSRILMPSGTILIGQFNNDVDMAQKRVLIAWNRAVTPDGKSVALGSTGTDRLGRSGTLGNVDNRTLTKFGAAALISAITVAPSVIEKTVSGSGSSGKGTTVNVGSSSGSDGKDVASSISEFVGEQSNSAMEKYLNLPPVIRVPQGEEIRIFVNRDLVFK